MLELALPTTRLLAVWTLAVCLILAAVCVNSASSCSGAQHDSGQGLGSVDEYEQTAPPSAEEYESPVLELELRNSTEWLGHSRWLEHRHWLNGVEILTVTPCSLVVKLYARKS